MKTMNFFMLVCFLALMSVCSIAGAQVMIGTNPGTINPAAVLELESDSLGLLIPQVSLTDVYDNVTVPNPANGLLVFNINFGGGTNPVMPGFYYWRTDQSRWLPLVSSIAGPFGDVWIDGNNNILSANSANQSLAGEHNVVLGYRAFADDAGISGNVIAIGEGAAQYDTTSGDARNIAIGYQAAFNNGGYDIIIMGREAGMNNTGSHVVGIGDYAGYDNQGSGVVALGERAAFTNTGWDVLALGFLAADSNNNWAVSALGNSSARINTGYIVNALGPQTCEFNSGNSVNGMGHLAAQKNQGSEVNAFGAMACQFNLESSVNALGNSAGKYNSGYSVNALGVFSAESNSGANVNALGASAAQFNSGFWVDAIGQSAAANNTGSNVTAMGYEAAYDNDGNHVIAIGQAALKGNGTIPEGEGNIGIGFQAGMNIGAGANNIAIGYDAQLPDGYASGQINIGNSIIRTSDGVIQLLDLLRLPPTTAPSSPEEGTVYYDGALHKLYCWDGTTWQGLW
jgi:hypothetical protein